MNNFIIAISVQKISHMIAVLKDNIQTRNHINVKKTFQLYFEEPPSTNRDLHIEENHINSMREQNYFHKLALSKSTLNPYS